MIWEADSAGEGAWDALRDHVTQALAALAPGGEPTEYQLRAVAEGVVRFCRETWPRAWVPEEDLWFLVARALCGAGLDELAGDVLRAHGHDAARDDYLSLLRQARASGALCRLCARRILRPVRWCAAGEAPVWVIDLDRALPRDEPLLEMSRRGMLRALVREVADLWNETRGRGCLGVRDGEAAGAEAGREGGETLRFVADVLEREGQGRNWVEKPRIMRLAPA